MERTVKERLMEFIEFLGLSKNAFEKECGLSMRTISNCGKTPNSDTIKKILLRFPELNTEWLMMGVQPMIKGYPRQSNSGDITITGNQNSNISNVGHGNSYAIPSAHPHTECQCAVYPILPDTVVRALDVNIEEWKRKNSDQCKSIDLREYIGKVSHVQKMIGRAMEPNIPEGTLLFLREINQWDEALLDGTIYGVDVARPHMIIRKVYDDGDHIRCAPTNGDFEAIRIPKEKVMNLYKVSAGLKKFD